MKRPSVIVLLLTFVLLLNPTSSTGQAQDDCPPDDLRAWLSGWQEWTNASRTVALADLPPDETRTHLRQHLLGIATLENPQCGGEVLNISIDWYGVYLAGLNCASSSNATCTAELQPLVTDYYDAMLAAAADLAATTNFTLDSNMLSADWTLEQPPKTGERATRVTIIAERTVNLRSGPGEQYPVVGQLASGQTAKITGRNGDWLMLAAGRWVASWVVSVSGDVDTLPNIGAPPAPTAAPKQPQAPAGQAQPTPQQPTPQPAQPAAPQPTSPPPDNTVSCGGATTCDQMTTCAQAYACLQAGNGRLDRDNDGIPCEGICGG